MANQSFMVSAGGSVGVTVATNTTRYFPSADAPLAPQTAEADSEITHRRSETRSNLYARIVSGPGVSTTATITVRKNGVDTSLAISTSGASAREVEDAVNTVSVVDGDETDIKVICGSLGSDFVIGNIAIRNKPDDADQTVVHHAAVAFADMSDGTTYFVALSDIPDDAAGGLATNEAHAQFEVGTATFFKNMRVRVSSATQSATNARFRKNGANSITVAIGTTAGVYEETATEVSCSAGDLVCFSVESVNAGALDIECMSIEERTTSDKFHSIFGRTCGSQMQAVFNKHHYFALGGGGELGAASAPLGTHEAKTKTEANIACTVSRLTGYCSTYTIS